MTESFCVWAPLPKKLEVQWGGDRFPMKLGMDGLWTGTVPPAKPDSDYGFVVDGAGPFPDPRSPWQPHGTDGLSRLVRHSEFRWTDGDWQAPPLSSSVIYELHVGTFTPEGTFDGVVKKLDYLSDLGITHVELMPVNEFSGSRGWGYDGVDLFAPHHAYGGPDQLKRLVNACHEHGLAVLLDVVYNHLGPSGNYLGKYAPYFTRRYSSPWGESVNFDDAESGQVRRFFCDNALMWLRDYHFDGLRIDAVHAIIDNSAIPFLEQLGAEVKQLGVELNRHFVLIPESDLNDPRLLWPHEHGGFGLDAQWSDDFHHSLHAYLTGEKKGYYADFGSLQDICRTLQNAFLYEGGYSRYRRRPHGRPPTGLDGNHFLGYMQNHDQVGNRAQGERSSRLMSIGRLKIAAALVLTSPFIPMLFQGEEWGALTPFLYFTDHRDQMLGEMVRQGRRREFAAQGWDESEIPDPQALETFQRSKLDWTEPSQPAHKKLLDWYKRLVALRRSEPSLCDGRRECVRTKHNEKERWLVVERGLFAVAANFSREPGQIHLPEKQEILMTSVPVERLENGALVLPPDSVVIAKQR